MLPEAIFDFVIGDLEGGDALTQDPLDPGGLTKWGLSKRANPDLDIASLTKLQAMAAYEKRYWQSIRGDELKMPVALAMFDCSVNQGATTAVKLLQKALGESIDGVFGPKTMTHLKETSTPLVLEKFMMARIERYLAGNGAAEERFEKGWVNRSIRVLSKCLRWHYEGID